MNRQLEILAPTITDHFGRDHQRLDEMLGRLAHLKETDLSAATCLFLELKAGLERHIGWEEQILFPIFEEKCGMCDGGPTAVMRWEHRQIQDLLAEIQASLARHQAVPGSAVVALKDLLRQHNHKEECVLYPAIDGSLDKAERAQVFAAMGRYSDEHSSPARL